MTEVSSSRLQKMLDDQRAWNDRLNVQIMRQGFEVVGYRTRNKQLETALRKIADIEHEDLPKPVGTAEGTLWVILAGCVEVAEKALEWKDD
jgi:hypothetical protein